LKTIWKFPFVIADETSCTMPEGAELLTVQVQGFGHFIWALVDPKAKKVRRTFRVIGTGYPIEDDSALQYVGTFQQRRGALVWHLFETTQ
jgi:hypothetical protein